MLFKVLRLFLALLCTALTSGWAATQAVTALPTSLSFGNQPEGTTSAVKKVTLKNGQSSAITIANISTNLADYATTSNCPVSPTTLAAGASCTISVSFAPTALGSRTATLTITDTGVSSPQLVSLSGTGTAPLLVSIAVTPAAPSIAAGNSQQFTATGTYSNGTTQNLTNTAAWSSSSPSVATVRGSTGLATGVAPGTTAIKAISGTISGSTSLTVTAALLTKIVVTPITASVAAGNSQQFTATGTYTNGSTQNLTSSVQWSSSLTTVATVSSGGLATSLAQGTSTITAKSGTISGSATLTVTAAVLTSITVTPATASVAAGKTQQFTATGTYSNGTTQNLTTTAAWTSSAPSIATVKVSTGLATGIAPGVTTIKAISGTINGSASLTVTPAVLVKLVLAPAAPSVAAGNSQQFTATGTYSNGSTQNLTSSVQWSSSAPAVATVSSGGLATSLAQGASTISGKSGTIIGSATLTVTAAILSSISVTPSTASIAAGNSQQFTATGTYSNGSTQNLTGAVQWASSAAAVATISSSGLAIGVAQGTSSVTAASGTINGSATLAVTPPLLTSISIIPASASIAKGTSQQFSATGTYSDGSTQNLTSAVSWTSSATTVATISAGGVAAGTGVGSSTISAALGSISASVPLSVGQPLLVSIAVTPANPSFALGTTLPLTATGTYSDGGTLDLTKLVSWNSANPSIATVDNAGLASSRAPGTTVATATSGTITGTTTLAITPATLVSIAVTPAIPTLPLGTTQQFTATGTYTDSSTQNITGTVQWSSDTPTVSTISNDAATPGLASSVDEGTSTISATSGSVSGSTTLTVTTAALVSIAIAPAAPSIALGTTQQFTATGTYTDGSTQNLTSTATWFSDTPATATITNAGLAQSIAQGAANITVTSGTVSSSTELTVTAAALVSVAINPTTPSTPLGTTLQFAATGTFTDVSIQDLTQSGHWSSTAAGVATISNTVNTAGLASTLGLGTTTIRFTSGSVRGSATLAVSPAALLSIVLAPQTPTIALGTAQQFTATGSYTDASIQDVTSSVAWNSSDATVAIISNSIGSYGLATSSGQGPATITATSPSGSISATTSITVGGPALVSIAISPASASLPLGTSQQFTAIGTYTDNSIQDLTASVGWTSDSPGVALINAAGLAAGTTLGTANINATLGTVEGSTAVAVTPPLLLSISIDPGAASIPKGTSQQFAAVGAYTDGSLQDLTSSVSWSASPPTVASIGSSGLATASGVGVAAITASAGAITASGTLNVGQPSLVSLTVTPANSSSSSSLALGTTQQLAATGTFSDGSTLDLTASVSWTAADENVTKVSPQGLVASVSVGNTQVTATQGSISGSLSITVTPAVLVSIAVTPAIPSIPLGTTQPFTASATYTDASVQDITDTVQWSSDTPTVATIGNTAPAAGVASSLSQGAAIIRASVGSVSGSTTLNVTSAALVSLAIAPPSPSVALGTSQQFVVIGTFSDGSMQDLSDTATWSSDTMTTATINNTGQAAGVGIGTANITAGSGSVTTSTVLTVTAAALVSIAISPAAPTISLGTTQQFTALGTFTDGTTQDVTQSAHWTSTAAAIATISDAAATAGLANTLSAGMTTIGVSQSGINASVPLVVTPATLVSIAITPQNSTVALGNTQQFTAMGTYSDGSTQDVTSVVTWSSSDATVAVISNSSGNFGLTTSSGPGAATITATFGSISSSSPINVTQAAITSIAVTPSSISILVGYSTQFTAIASFSDGSSQDVTQSATWASSDASVAAVSSTGLATGALGGSTAISASVGSVNNSALLTVTAPSPVSVVITPASVTASAGAQVQFGATLLYNDGSSADVTGGVTWSSSNPAAETISGTGLGLSLSAGSTTISATWAGDLTASANITVYSASTFFVSPTGNDSWSGVLADPNPNRSDGPFASLSRAQYAIEHAPKPATVMLRNGTYYLATTPSTVNAYSGPLSLSSGDSGISPSAQVTWQNYPGETPVVSGGVPANSDAISGAGLHLQWTNTGNWYQAPLPATLSNNISLQPFEYLYYNGQRRLRSRIHDDGTSQYPSMGFFMQNGQCVASPSTPAGQKSPTLASCNLGTFLRVKNTIAPSSALGQGCPYESGLINNVTVSKCLDRFVYSDTSHGDPIQAWQNLNGMYTGNPTTPCAPNPANPYPAGDVELTLVDAWTVDIMRVNCVDTTDKVIFLSGPTAGGGTVGSSNSNYNYLGPTIGHRFIIENSLNAFNEALTPTSAQYGITGIWFLDRHATPWVLNYIANENENPNADNIVIPQLGGVIPGAPAKDYIGGSLISATGLNYVTFQGIAFEMDNFYPNNIGFNNDVNGEMPAPQAIDCENCQFVTFNSVTVRHTSASGILAGATVATPACSGSTPPSCVVIENSTFYDIGDSGIRIGHATNTTDTAARVVQQVLAQNNLIQGYSRVFLDGDGIAEGNGNNNQFFYNTITDGYHKGISICQSGCGPTKSGISISGNNIVSSYNLISNVMQGITSDGGALYYNIGNGTSSGKGNSVTNNLVNNITDSYIIDNPSTAGVTVAGSAYGGNGIYLDALSAGVQVANNVVYNLSGYAIALTEGLASSKESQNTFNNNIFAFANLGMFFQQTPWPTGCPSSPIKEVDVTNNIFYFDRLSTSIPSFSVIQGCKDSCKHAYSSYQNFQGNIYWRTDGQFAADSKAFQVLTSQGLNSNNTCRNNPTTSLYFSSQTAPSWQSGGAGVPVAMNEDLSPNSTASYAPPFTGSGLAGDLPTAFSLPPGQVLPAPFIPGNTNLTISNAHSSLPKVGNVPATFPTYVYGDPLNKF